MWLVAVQHTLPLLYLLMLVLELQCLLVLFLQHLLCLPRFEVMLFSALINLWFQLLFSS